MKARLAVGISMSFAFNVMGIRLLPIEKHGPRRDGASIVS